MTHENLLLGSFEIVSGSMIVSDPCYAADVWCCNRLESVANGVWDASITYEAADSFGVRVERLIIVHPSFNESIHGMEVAPFVVGVDSGQAGFFDVDHYRDCAVIDTDTSSEDENTWYRHCCDITLSRQQAGVMPFGVVSSSGYGDGVYDCHAWRNERGEIVRAEIIFIEDVEEDWDDDAGDECYEE